jgi:hypothetical protein
MSLKSSSLKSYTMGEIARRSNVDLRTFKKFFLPQHYIDMAALGWVKSNYKITPKVCRYIEQVVVGEKSRLEVFPDLDQYIKTTPKISKL